MLEVRKVLYIVILIAFFSVNADAQINEDPRVAGIQIHVKKIAIASDRAKLGHGVTRAKLIKKAAKIRSAYSEQMDFSQIQEVADELTKYLRKKGFKFHYAFVKPQKPKEGVITISIAEIVLGDVNVINRSFVGDKRIQKSFERFLGKPLYQPDIDKSLLPLNQLEELNIFAFYSKGSIPRSVRLNIRVESNRRFNGLLSIDNYGASSSGKARTFVQGSILSPVGMFDQLDLGAMYSFGNASNQYGFARYTFPFFSLNQKLSIYASNSAFEVGGDFADIGLEGASQFFSASFKRYFSRGKRFDQSFSVLWGQKENDYTSDFNDVAIEPDEESTFQGVQWHIRYRGQSVYHSLLGRYDDGEFSFAGDTELERAYKKASANYTFFASLKSVSRKTLVGFEFSYRYQSSDKKLPSFERMSLTGAYATKSIEAGQFSVDEGSVVNLSLSFPSLFSKLFKKRSILVSPSLLADFSEGTRYDLEGNELDTGSFSSAGISFDITVKKNISMEIVGLTNINAETDSGRVFEKNQLMATLAYRW